MHNNRKIICDIFSDVYDLLKPWVDSTNWELCINDPQPDHVYVIGRKQFFDHASEIKEVVAQDIGCTIIFANSAEGSSTQTHQLSMLGIDDLVKQGKIKLITGGRMSGDYPENISESRRNHEIYHKKNKPYKFLFLNGRNRPHRKYLYEKFRLDGLLDNAIWTMLEGRGYSTRVLQLRHNGEDLMSRDCGVRHLDAKYEVQKYRGKNFTDQGDQRAFIKYNLFDNEWGDIYLRAEPYIDTYFSLVTETILEYPYSFFTEKIAKPLAMGHPWIVASNRGFYQDIRNMGFRTFNNIIDESFDLIDDDHDRLNRVFSIVKDLCQSDLGGFLEACQEICKYNQEHLKEVIKNERQSFPNRFFGFINHE